MCDIPPNVYVRFFYILLWIDQFLQTNCAYEQGKARDKRRIILWDFICAPLFFHLFSKFFAPIMQRREKGLFVLYLINISVREVDLEKNVCSSRNFVILEDENLPNGHLESLEDAHWFWFRRPREQPKTDLQISLIYH